MFWKRKKELQILNLEPKDLNANGVNAFDRGETPHLNFHFRCSTKLILKADIVVFLSENNLINLDPTRHQSPLLATILKSRFSDEKTNEILKIYK